MTAIHLDYEKITFAANFYQEDIPTFMKHILFLILLFPVYAAIGQGLNQKLTNLKAKKTKLQDAISDINIQVEEIQLQIIQSELKEFGSPALGENEQLILHSGMALVYSEKHEQAKWVSHVIMPDIITGKGYRTNDFRPDPKIKSGTAIEKDYFLKIEKGNGEFEYDGFGYDRGHLAPSADFKWSSKALSESYYYSNMTPQLAEFNRGIWADLENAIRGYIYRNPQAKLYITTGGILDDDLPVIERSINKVAIPQYFYKVVVDPKNKRGIGFLLPHKSSESPLETFAYTIDHIEEVTGINFYIGLANDSEIESTVDKSLWLTDLQDGNVESLTLKTVPRKKSYPTTFGKQFMNKGITINTCGHVVGGRYSRKGNLLLNLDKKFPNHTFTIFIKKEHLVNFNSDPLNLVDNQVCVKGEINSIGGTPTVFLKDENKLEVITE